MKYLRQIALILALWFLGELIHYFFKLPIPGNVIGMLILLVGLITKLIKVEMLEETSDFLMNHLAFFFIPAGVGLLTCMDIIKKAFIPLSLTILFSTIIVLVVTGLTVQAIQKRSVKKNG